MPKRISPEKISGIVALSYLILIPAGGYLAWQKLNKLDADLTKLWDHVATGAQLDEAPISPTVNLRKRFGLV